MTKKEYITSKLDLFKELYPDYKISKSNNYYAQITKFSTTKLINPNCTVNVTKKSIDKLYQGAFSLTKSTGSIILLKPKTGQILLQYNNVYKKIVPNSKFLRVHLRNMENLCLDTSKFLKLVFYNKRYAWLINYPNKTHFRILSQFNSLDEFQDFIGYGFMDQGLFESYFQDNTALIIDSYKLSPESRVNLALAYSLGQYHISECYTYISNKLSKFEEVQIPNDINVLKENIKSFYKSQVPF